MTKRILQLAGSLAAPAVGAFLLASSLATAEPPPPDAEGGQRGHERTDVAAGSVPHRPDARPPVPVESKPGEHPLAPVLRWAEKELPAMEKIQDYSASFVRRERIRGKLGPYEYMNLKIRHQPFSVYVGFLGPTSLKGQEAIYVAGRNQGNMWAHRPRMPTTVSLDPEGLLAMKDQHYPITQIGLVNLVRRLVEVGKQDLKHDECEVKYFTAAKINKRLCTAIEVVHPVQRDAFVFHMARIFVDDELKVPIRYESYDWPAEAGGKPRLIEEYTYLDLKLNNGFTDQDFNVRNPQYEFPAGTGTVAQR